MRAHELAQLRTLTEAKWNAEQAKLAKLLQREAEVAQQMSDLVVDRGRSSQAPRVAGDAALRAGADVRWHRWIDSRRELLGQELAQIRAQKEYQISALRVAFGRHQVVERLMNKARAKEQKKMDARAASISD